METITPKGWSSFQHYKDRKPAWIKLHRDILDNFDFHRLPLASKALAPCLWLLASEYENGAIPADWALIGFRLRMAESDVEVAVSHLISSGFFVASGALAECKQDACLEKEKEKEKEREIDTTPLTPLAGGGAVSDGEQPQKTKRKPRAKSESMLADWLTACRDEGLRPIPEDDPIRQWAEDAGIPPEYMGLAWKVFCRDWKAKKPQKDWPATFRDAVKRNWLKLWYIDANGECRLTTVGQQEQRAVGDA